MTRKDMNWLRLETRTRAVLRAVVDARDAGRLVSTDPMDALRAISDILGEETGRGYVFGDEGQDTPEAFCNRVMPR